MSSEFGNLVRVSVFGQSHGRAIGVVVDGLPAGEAVDREELQRCLDRRRPGGSPLSTARRETDVPEFLSGLEDGRTCQVAFLMKSYTEETGAACGAQVERGSVRTFLREWLEEQGTVSPGGNPWR